MPHIDLKTVLAQFGEWLDDNGYSREAAPGEKSWEELGRDFIDSGHCRLIPVGSNPPVEVPPPFTPAAHFGGVQLTGKGNEPGTSS